MARTPNETKPTQFRLSDQELADIDRIAEHYGLKSRVDAVRLAVKGTVDGLPARKPKRKPKPPPSQ